MAVDFNHTIVWAQDSQASATFLAEVLGLPAPRRWGPFLVVTTDNGTNIDFINADSDITPQHYAFLVSESEFDEIFGRISSGCIGVSPISATPRQSCVLRQSFAGTGWVLCVVALEISRSRRPTC